MTATEHLAWAKERAYAYESALLMWQSFISDLHKHAELRAHPRVLQGVARLLNDDLQDCQTMRTFISQFGLVAPMRRLVLSTAQVGELVSMLRLGRQMCQLVAPGMNAGLKIMLPLVAAKIREAELPLWREIVDNSILPPQHPDSQPPNYEHGLHLSEAELVLLANVLVRLQTIFDYCGAALGQLLAHVSAEAKAFFAKKPEVVADFLLKLSALGINYDSHTSLFPDLDLP